MILPRKPRYPCPFISPQEIAKYLPMLYKSGWTISVGKSSNMIPSTMLAKSINLQSLELASNFMQQVEETIIKSENHHPAWERLDSNVVRILVQTHSAMALEGRKNKDDDHPGIDIPQKRPGITLRDIRFAMLVEKLLLQKGHYDNQEPNPSQPSLFQPTDFDSVHNLHPIEEST